MASRLIVFTPEDLYALLVHYDNGQHLPLDAQVVGFNVNKLLGRLIGLDVRSDNWPSDGVEIGKSHMPVIHVRYEGKRVMSWDEKGAEPEWTKAPESPTRQ